MTAALILIGASLGLSLLALLLLAISSPVDVGPKRSGIPETRVDMVI